MDMNNLFHDGPRLYQEHIEAIAMFSILMVFSLRRCKLLRFFAGILDIIYLQKMLKHEDRAKVEENGTQSNGQ